MTSDDYLRWAGGAAFVLAWFYGRWRSKVITQLLRAELHSAAAPINPTNVDFAELEGLPTPVDRFFRTVLKAGQPMVVSALLRQEGSYAKELRLSKPAVTSDCLVVTNNRGYERLTGSRVKGLLMAIREGLVKGEGLAQLTMQGFGLKMRRSAHAESDHLLRFLAESVWYPTALLPSQGIKWEAMDDSSARACLRTASANVNLIFTFSKHASLVKTVRTVGTGRTLGKVKKPWMCRFGEYEIHGGMWIPPDVEYIWPEEGGKEETYLRLHTTSIEYVFTK